MMIELALRCGGFIGLVDAKVFVCAIYQLPLLSVTREPPTIISDRHVTVNMNFRDEQITCFLWCYPVSSFCGINAGSSSPTDRRSIERISTICILLILAHSITVAQICQLQGLPSSPEVPTLT